jgi:hypothetical protein
MHGYPYNKMKNKNIILSTFQNNEIQQNWDIILPFVEKVINRIDLFFTSGDIKEALINKKMQLWACYEGSSLTSICITRIINNHDNKFIEIVLMSGKLNSIMLLEQIEDWARSMGCKQIKLEGRKGWERVLRNYKTYSIKSIVTGKQFL